MIILEYPHTSAKIGLLARKDGEYVRPIVGALLDIRLEDVLPSEYLKQALVTNFIGKLPDIPQINQKGKFFVSEFNVVRIEPNKATIQPLLNTGAYLLLPSTPKDELYKYTGAPWWEYAVVLDDHGQYIKAPREPRAMEPGPEEIDERLDDYRENRNRIDVISPIVLQKIHDVREDYLTRLTRI